jgi:hypothetical protein
LIEGFIKERVSGRALLHSDQGIAAE